MFGKFRCIFQVGQTRQPVVKNLMPFVVNFCDKNDLAAFQNLHSLFVCIENTRAIPLGLEMKQKKQNNPIDSRSSDFPLKLCTSRQFKSSYFLQKTFFYLFPKTLKEWVNLHEILLLEWHYGQHDTYQLNGLTRNTQRNSNESRHMLSIAFLFGMLNVVAPLALEVFMLRTNIQASMLGRLKFCNLAIRHHLPGGSKATQHQVTA